MRAHACMHVCTQVCNVFVDKWIRFDIHIHMCMYIYIYTQKRRLWGLRFGNPLFSVILHVSNGCAWVSVSVGRSFGAHACMFLFPTTTSALNCFKPGGLFTNTGFVYKHCVSVYRAFSVFEFVGFALCLLCLLYDS